jgi:hypothetical protein
MQVYITSSFVCLCRRAFFSTRQRFNVQPQIEYFSFSMAPAEAGSKSEKCISIFNYKHD